MSPSDSAPTTAGTTMGHSNGMIHGGDGSCSSRVVVVVVVVASMMYGPMVVIGIAVLLVSLNVCSYGSDVLLLSLLVFIFVIFYSLLTPDISALSTVSTETSTLKS